MLSTYKEKIAKEIRRVPDDKMPKLYRVIHLFCVKIINEKEGYFYPLTLTNPLEVVYEND